MLAGHTVRVRFCYFCANYQQGASSGDFLQSNSSLTTVQCLLRNRIPHAKYENLISKLLNGERLPQESGVLELMYASAFLIFILGLTAIPSQAERKQDPRVLCPGGGYKDEC